MRETKSFASVLSPSLRYAAASFLVSHRDCSYLISTFNCFPQMQAPDQCRRLLPTGGKERAVQTTADMSRFVLLSVLAELLVMALKPLPYRAVRRIELPCSFQIIDEQTEYVVKPDRRRTV